MDEREAITDRKLDEVVALLRLICLLLVLILAGVAIPVISTVPWSSVIEAVWPPVRTILGYILLFGTPIFMAAMALMPRDLLPEYLRASRAKRLMVRSVGIALTALAVGLIILLFSNPSRDQGEATAAQETIDENSGMSLRELLSGQPAE